VTGSYANAVTATGDTQQCGASYVERVSGVRIGFRSTAASIDYDPAAHTFAGALRYSAKGSWKVTGAYTPLVPQPDGTLACGTTRTPVSCGARVIFEDGHRTSTSGPARLAVDTTGRNAVVSKVVAPRLTEQYADAGTPPAGWPAACTTKPQDDTISAAPVFGLAATTVLDRAVAAGLTIPATKLRGRRAFSVTAASARPAFCPAEGFDPCTERGSFRLRVTLSRAKH
jgi:hypothetical protein